MVNKQQRYDIIKVSDLKLIERDIINVIKREDFDNINHKMFNNTLVYDLNGALYLLGEILKSEQ